MSRRRAMRRRAGPRPVSGRETDADVTGDAPAGGEPEEGTRVRLFSASGDDPFENPEALETPKALDPGPIAGVEGDESGDESTGAPPVDVDEGPIGAPPERTTAIVNAGPASSPPPAFARGGGRSSNRRRGSSNRRGRDRDTSPRWRSLSIRSRIMSLVALGVVLTALVSMLGSIAIGEVDDRATTVTDVADARRHNIRAADSLRELHLLASSPDADAQAIGELQRRHTTAVARLEATFGGDAALEDTIDQAAVLDAAYLDGVDTAGSISPGDAGDLDDALAVRQEIDDSLAARSAVARDELDSGRTTAVVTLILLVLSTAIVLPVLGLAITRSIVDPLRRVGRVMRRFGDGDLRARATEAPDEVGALARSFNALADGAGRRIRDLSSDAERGTQLRVITEALELATEEDDVHRIVEHASAILTPGVNLEMLLNDPGSSRLRQVAVNPTATAPNCPVPDTAGCVAIRRGHTVTFDQPDSLNACPWLRDRPKGPCSAVCVPANAGGHVLGVLHATAAVGAPPSGDIVEQMVTIASQASTRIGSMRTLETTRTLAATDTLTGLANRRSVESRIGDLLRTGSPFVLAVADLDHFKAVNDNYGHEFGDRALQLFAEVLAENVRGHDLVARFGGEEFVLVYPGMDVQRSMEVIERIRVALARAVQQGGMPEFTCSFGITHSSVAGDVETIIRIADAGLLLAKERGRNRVVYADADIAASVFDHDPANGRLRPRNPETASDVVSEDDTF